jgi:hypothetical protein
MLYYFYRANDPTHEPIDKVQCDDFDTALEVFSGRKKLPIEEFKKIYKIGGIVKL